MQVIKQASDFDRLEDNLLLGTPHHCKITHLSPSQAKTMSSLPNLA